MALTLDPRQRAMLQEMGITVWLPKTAAPIPAPAAIAPVLSVAVAVAAPPVERPVPASEPAAPKAAAPEARTVAPITAPSVTEQGAETIAWQISPALQAYPQATGGSAADAWLVIWECPNPAAPLEGDSGKLLNNMLRALRLHHSPYVWLASVQRPGHEALPAAGIDTDAIDWQDLAQGLPHCVVHTKPARILVLGLHTARAVLGSQEALGRLRAQVHTVHSTPAVVSYDPAYLLRSPHAKPAAWADLCRAHALHPPSAS
jgi:uracil-DNA glycosylase